MFRLTSNCIDDISEVEQHGDAEYNSDPHRRLAPHARRTNALLLTSYYPLFLSHIQDALVLISAV